MPVSAMDAVVPYALRLTLIRDSALFGTVVRVFVRSVFAWPRRRAKVAGFAQVHCGSVTLAQRFGSLLQLHPHAHSWIPDGVFVVRPDGGLRFVPLDPPTEAELAALCERIARRVLRLVERHQDAMTCEDEDDAAIAADQALATRSPLQRAL